MVINNDGKAHTAFIDYAHHSLVMLITCEPAGGYERVLCKPLSASNIPVDQVHIYSFSALTSILR